MKMVTKRARNNLLRIFLIVSLATSYSTESHGQMAYAKPVEFSSNFYIKNITHSNDHLEMNPRFVENGSHVLFLVFNGDSQSPKPWDYLLSKSDRDGHTEFYLTTKGVLDYNILPNQTGILVLRVVPSLQTENLDSGNYEDFRDWELWYLNLQSGEELLLETSMGLPISEGYKMLGMASLPDGNSVQFLKNSPQNTTQILIQRETQGEFLYFNFYLVDNFARKKKIFMTESWQSYSDMHWWPSLIWLNETKFITIGFYSDVEQSLPQSEGLFSIVQMDLNDFRKEILYTDLEIKPFPKFVLNPSMTDLYFQKAGKQPDSTELWKLHLVDKNAEMIYSVQGDLGEIRFSSDGSSFVFTQLLANNFDIIRVDLDRNHIRQLVGK